MKARYGIYGWISGIIDERLDMPAAAECQRAPHLCLCGLAAAPRNEHGLAAALLTRTANELDVSLRNMLLVSGNLGRLQEKENRHWTGS